MRCSGVRGSQTPLTRGHVRREMGREPRLNGRSEMGVRRPAGRERGVGRQCQTRSEVPASLTARRCNT